MAQSKFVISTTTYNLNIQEFSDTNNPVLNEKTVVIDPTDPDGNNSILIGNGNARHTFTISGFCTISEKGTFVSALRNNTKVYPSIYPDGGSTNVIDSGAYYYIANLTGNYIMANNSYWYTITCIYGGV